MFYLNQMYDQVLSNVIPDARLPNVTLRFSGSQITLTSAFVSYYKKPLFYLTRLQLPDRVNWRLEHMDIGFKVRIDA